MNLLPQRKKSAEEIAKLRESIGVPATTTGKSEAYAQEMIQPLVQETLAAHRSETPVAFEEKSASEPLRSPHLPKPVRSLRRSEQIPILHSNPPTPSADSKIPFQRHSNDEIAEIRRRDTLAMLAPQTRNPKLSVAHITILIPGYLCAIAGVLCFFTIEFPMIAAAACAASALLIAAFVFARHPLSRHHAAFISVITLLVLAFGTIHYFPELQHAT